MLTPGSGKEKPTAADTAQVHYSGLTPDGVMFDSSVKRGEPATFATDQVIQGFGAALVGQKVGTKLIVTIPPELAYGTDPAAHELGGQTLVFLVEIEGTEAPAEGTEPPSE